MQVPSLAGSHLHKPGCAKTANRLFGGTINDFKPDVFRRACTPIPEKPCIDRLQSLAPRCCVAINNNDKERVALAIRKTLLASKQLLAYELRGVLRKSFSRIGRKNSCCGRRLLGTGYLRWGDH